ncbi:lipoprotein releasing system, transmembrane protein, LolC/E family [Nereida ignava]|uniref:Lipoprotein releasing system, transmembrane protein, LolC/E family n=1 Tax=Nereida ignava TaxID=282199 RepID=A0A0U1NLF5_9RHOB|nr:FtsX-like permease family protein [Nereida ignava]CRK75544.1 lipoprotein releasing system, transmembrane protein, LolC/E family [Nereida ignava]SFJ50477.1 putative ABC transport system permease protein [Nereida ignava DSM 16309]
MKTAWIFATRELRSGLRGFGIFLACLALGIAAIAAVGSTRTAILKGLERDGAALLGGDAELQFTYRFATADERAWMQSQAIQVSEITDFRSMIVVPSGADTSPERALTQVKSVDAAYPLVGEVKLSPEMPLDQAIAANGAVMERVLADRLGLMIGDSFSIGTGTFRLSAILQREPDNAGGGFGLGPRTLVRTESLANAGLLQTGTLFDTKYRMLLPEGTELAALERDAEQRFANSGLRWTDARNGAPGVQQFVDRLGAFLVLVGLSGLAVGGVGVSAAVRSYLERKTSVIATLKTLGASRSTIFATYAIQIGLLTILGIAIGLVLGAALPLALAPIIEARLPVPAEFAIHPKPLIEAAIYGAFAAAIFTLWPLARTENIRAATLFRDALGHDNALPRKRYLFLTAGLVAALVLSAIAFSGTAFLTLWTAGGIIAVLGVLALAARGLRALAAAATKMRALRGRPALRLALGAIGGPREQASSAILSLGLGLSVLAAVGQIDGNLRGAIARDLPDVAPSYFFVDIQSDQLNGFNARLAGDPAVSRVDTAPMLRGVISKINDRPAKEIAGDHWVLQGDRGVTYAQTAADGVTITQGSWWPADYTGAPQISFAAEEAEEMGLVLGDTMTINILGRDITGTITSFREVDFSTAGIGFILTMNPAALQGAPHSHIATVYATPEAEAEILRDLAGTFPNITAIRVADAIARVGELLASLAAATSLGASATLITGFLVLIGAAAAGVDARTFEAAVLKTLGASKGVILKSFALRAGLLGAAAGTIALIAGLTFAWAVSTFVMETSFAIVWGNALAIIIGGVAATMLAFLGYAWGPLKARPAGILRRGN